jgi:hypothetical protein
MPVRIKKYRLDKLRAIAAQSSKKFQRWKPRHVLFKLKDRLDLGVAIEKHYSPTELAAVWGLSADTVRRMFENEPDVLIYGDEKSTDRKRRYRTMKIPESVAVRIHRRLTSRPARVGVR